MGPRSSRAIVAAALALCLALPAAAAGTTRVSAPAGGATASAAQAVAETSRYWTPARMRSARPLDAMSGARAAAEALATASFVRVPDATAFPYAVNGRVFMRREGRPAFCSGTAINSASRQLVLTAGHCVNSGPVDVRRRSLWFENIQFVPAYTGDVAPFGAFVAQEDAVFALRPWTRFRNHGFDLGAFLTHPNEEGVNLADAVGGVTVAMDISRKQQFQTFGYPGSTRYLNTCNSPFVGSDRRTNRLAGPPTMTIRCRWKPGASGGGWLIAGGTQINGLNSYITPRDRVHSYGPYFSGATVGKLIAGL